MRPLRAFPLAINVGTDICQISRIHGILRSPRGTRFANRILAPEERPRWEKKMAEETKDVDGLSRAAFLAGRFAAKEAAIKAHSDRKLTFHDVIIEKREVDGERLGSGPPIARIRGEGEEDESALVSISHDGDYATAVCVAALKQ